MGNRQPFSYRNLAFVINKIGHSMDDPIRHNKDIVSTYIKLAAGEIHIRQWMNTASLV